MSNEKKQESCRQPIGVFDSGMGGISVLRELVKRSEERRVGKECRSRWSPYH